MKAQNAKNWKQPTCSRAQKNLDKQDDNSNERTSSPSSASTNSSSNGCIGSPHVLAGSQSSIESHTGNDIRTSTNGGTGMHGTHQLHWSPPGSSLHGPNNQPSSAQVNQAYNTKDPRRISDFQTLCLTFPDFSSSHLQALFEQSGNDFQRTIDRILMNKWYNDPESRQMPHHHPYYQQMHQHQATKQHGLNENHSVHRGAHISGHHLPHFSQMMTAELHATSPSINECNVQGSSSTNAYPYTYPSSNNSCDWRSRYASSNDYYCQDGYRQAQHPIPNSLSESSHDYRVSQWRPPTQISPYGEQNVQGNITDESTSSFNTNITSNATTDLTVYI